MNTVSHALLGYAVSAAIFGPEVAHQHMTPIIVASTIMDLDHLPYFLKHTKEVVKTGMKGHASPYLQGVLHRVHSQLIFLLIMLILSFFIDKTMVSLITLNVFLHMAVDALVDSHYHAFLPFSKDLLSIRIFGEKLPRTICDIVSVPLLALIVWII